MPISTKRTEASLTQRILRFYELLGQEAWRECYGMIDPAVRVKPASVTLYQYENAARQFLGRFGSPRVQEVRVQLHLGKPSKLYGDRDFAVGQTTWLDRAGDGHMFQERWVRDGRRWYTRCTGFVTPAETSPGE